ncbi:hypothetical protein IFM58399_09227 [Aspergillus lentulus]|uniref:uncharacterized protein n=1 Tax=Aspergillus lentulus TaxID=293939 RepID=UPI0013947109|nr:uncharacterized protein IFM58399_09227 [Aspergillus lentulus]GFF52055.1 hypothetical protein IFM58399_09227 [Aspergillus lentulus]
MTDDWSNGMHLAGSDYTRGVHFWQLNNTISKPILKQPLVHHQLNQDDSLLLQLLRLLQRLQRLLLLLLRSLNGTISPPALIFETTDNYHAAPAGCPDTMPQVRYR